MRAHPCSAGEGRRSSSSLFLFFLPPAVLNARAEIKIHNNPSKCLRQNFVGVEGVCVCWGGGGSEGGARKTDRHRQIWMRLPLNSMQNLMAQKEQTKSGVFSCKTSQDKEHEHLFHSISSRNRHCLKKKKKKKAAHPRNSPPPTFSPTSKYASFSNKPRQKFSQSCDLQARHLLLQRRMFPGG